MSVNSVIFANTRAYSAMTSMLTAERYQRLLDCENTAELKKCLTEFSFEGNSLDEMFNAAADKIYAYLDSESPVEKVRLALLKKNDYHNAKVMAKCKYARREITDDLLYSHGAVDTAKMKGWVLSDEYRDLPAPMREALEQIDLAFSQGKRSGRVIDCLLNKAKYQDIFATLGSHYKEMREVFAAEADFENISAALRIRKNGLTSGALEDEFIPGGTLSKEKISVLLNGDENAVLRAFRGEKMQDAALKAFAESEKDALVDFERMADDYVIDYLVAHRNDSQNYMLFYGYVLARLYELKNVRIVCGGVKAGEPKESIRKKLRKLYV